jgi:hypothetical protein
MPITSHCMYKTHFLHPFVCWLTLRYFHMIAIARDAVMTTGVHICLRGPDSILLSKCPAVELWNHMGFHFQVFWGLLFHITFHSLVHILHPTAGHRVSVSPLPWQHLSFVFQWKHPNRYGVISFCEILIHDYVKVLHSPCYILPVNGLVQTGASFTPIILATWEAEIGGILVWSQPQQKSLQDPISREKSLKVAHVCHPSNNRKCKIGGSQFWLAWTKSETQSLK